MSDHEHCTCAYSTECCYCSAIDEAAVDEMRQRPAPYDMGGWFYTREPRPCCHSTGPHHHPACQEGK